jgi:nucleotide-binding universal stress UspA family protein
MDACLGKKIGGLLLATDGSEFSEGAVREGIRLAKTCGAKVTALRVIEFNPEFEAMAPDAVEKMETGARNYVDSVKAGADKEGVACEALVRRGVTPHEQIVEEAQKLKTDMIVMGRRGRTGLKRLLMGSVTARVVGHSPVNVLVVPRAAEMKLENVLIATDGSSFSEAAALEAVCIAKDCGGSVVAISVAEDEKAMDAAKANTGNVEEIARKEGVNVEAMVEKGRAEEAIVGAAKQKGCDLIVVGSHGRTGVARLLMGSVTERVIGLSESAVLVVKTGK